MQDSVRLFVKCCAETNQCKGPIYEFGSLQVPGQEGYADMRQFFHGLEYTGCDMRAGVGVDRIENLEEGVSLADNTASTVLCLETIEHAFNVFKAIEEMKRVLKRDEGGVLIISSLFEFGIHSYPFDYWRFTPECFARLMTGFDIVMVLSQGDPTSPRSVFGIGVRTSDSDKWRDILSGIAGKFEVEIKKVKGHDSSTRSKLKMVFYRLFQKKKYCNKINKAKVVWFIREQETG